MWCTRWFLPLLLLPLPTASPYFLLLFLFSLTMHAKPCFYCIVLLTTLFVSSCYWQPFPLDSPLSMPWAENITTFAEALNNTIAPNYTGRLPDVMRTVDRCWCDFSTGGLFEPFNITHWELTSIQRLKDDLERQQSTEDSALKGKDSQKDSKISSSLSSTHLVDSPTSGMPRTPPPVPIKSTSPSPLNIRSILRFFHGGATHELVPLPSPDLISHPPSTPIISSRPRMNSEEKGYLIRKEYDLRPYGIGIFIDFSWTR